MDMKTQSEDNMFTKNEKSLGEAQVDFGNNNNRTNEVIETTYSERYTLFVESENAFKNVTQEHKIVTEKRVPKLGVMLVGLGGNNGTTMVAGILANKKKLSWATKNGPMQANFFGSFT